jgi:hypothetical protein
MGHGLIPPRNQRCFQAKAAVLPLPTEAPCRLIILSAGGLDEILRAQCWQFRARLDPRLALDQGQGRLARSDTGLL